MSDRVEISDLEIEVDADEEPEYLDTGYPWHEELNFNKDIQTEYLPEGEDDLYEEEPEDEPYDT